MKVKLTKETVDKILEEGKLGSYTDVSIPRFFLRIQKDPRSGHISSGYFITYRDKYGKRRTPGVVSTKTPLTFAQIKKKASDMLAIVDSDGDPMKEKQDAKKELNMSELCDLYMSEGTSHKKASTLAIDKGRITHHIKPLIGSIMVSELNAGHIEKMMLKIIKGEVKSAKESEKKRGKSVVTGGPEAANRTVQLLSAIINFAIRRELIDRNPAKLVNRPKANKKEVFLDIDEIRTLGEALRDKQHTGKKLAIQAVKLLLLTGCRPGEALSLKWKYVDIKNQCFRFPDTKTGKQTRPFGKAALKLLEQMQGESDSQWVFPATKGDGHYDDISRPFKKIYSSKPLDKDGNPIKDATSYIEKEGVTPHSLRHSFASIANFLGFNEFTIAGLVGHRLRGVTNRYSHNVDSSLINAADKVSSYIDRALKGLKDTKEEKIIDIANYRGA